MKHHFLSVGLSLKSPALAELIVDTLGVGPWQVEATVAYATSNMFSGDSFEAVGRWLIGLNDYISAPSLLKGLMADKGVDLRVAEKKSGIFHPKLYLLSSVDATETALLIGSGNLTSGGFKKNVEAFTLLICEGDEDKHEVNSFFNQYWETGIQCTGDIIEKYAAAKADVKKPAQPSSQKKSELSLALLEAQTAIAPVLWIVIGKGMSKGREIEFPKDAAPFFSIDGALKEFDFSVEDIDGNVELCPFRRRLDNGMWRITLNSALAGTHNLRIADANGTLLRSTKIAVFTRKSLDRISVTFAEIGSKNHDDLREASAAQNDLATTSTGPGGREYGFLN